MPLPSFNELGDLPEGRQVAPLDEVLARFGSGTAQRPDVTDRLRRIFSLAVATGHLDRLVIFGSYVSDIAEPNDVDVLLVMHNDFTTESCPAESLVLFDHARADQELGAKCLLGPSRDAAGRAAGAAPDSLGTEAGRPPPRYCGGPAMIQNDQELKVTQERIAYFIDLLARLRQSSRPEELALVTSGYRAEVERMQREMLDYLTQPAAPTAKAG
jgi:hypothetical protein